MTEIFFSRLDGNAGNLLTESTILGKGALLTFSTTAQAWTIEDIRHHLIEATDTLRRLPLPKNGLPAQLRAGWPDVVHDWMAYAYTPARAPRSAPSAEAIGRLDETLGWLHCLTRDQRMILWARAQGWTWRKIEALDDDERLGRGRQERQLRSICGDAEARIMAELNGSERRMVIPIREQVAVA